MTWKRVRSTITNSGALMLEAAAQGLGIAIMHDDHLRRASDNRLTNLPGVPVESPYSYWFVCKPVALESRPVRIFQRLAGARGALIRRLSVFGS